MRYEVRTFLAELSATWLKRHNVQKSGPVSTPQVKPGVQNVQHNRADAPDCAKPYRPKPPARPASNM